MTTTRTGPLVDRRSFLGGSAALAAGALAGSNPFAALAASAERGRPPRRAPRGEGGYGLLGPVPDRRDGVARLALPLGFSYLGFGFEGDPMSDGNPTPKAHDGMAALALPDGTLRLVRNHEDRDDPGVSGLVRGAGLGRGPRRRPAPVGHGPLRARGRRHRPRHRDRLPARTGATPASTASSPTGLHLLEAARSIDPAAQLVLCAGAPDTPAIGAEVGGRVAKLRQSRDGVVWIERMLPRATVIQILSHATVFVCPSSYEPFGLVNVEAMACEAAVVATATGGIPEIVVEGETGYLVPLNAADEASPEGSDRFARELAWRVNELLADPETAVRLGQAGRRRVLEHFSWPVIAEETVSLYRRMLR